MIPSRFRPVRSKKRPKTCDFGGRQTSSPIKWGLVVSHPSNIVYKSYFSYARYHSQQIGLNPSKLRPVRLKKMSKTFDLWGRQKNKPIKWGLNVTHPVHGMAATTTDFQLYPDKSPSSNMARILTQSLTRLLGKISRFSPFDSG